MTSSEQLFEQELIAKLKELKYSYRNDTCDRAWLKANFRENFQQLKHIKLTNEEFHWLLEDIGTPDVFTAAQTHCSRNSFTCQNGTSLNYTSVHIDDWCKSTLKVVNQLRINTDYSHYRFDLIPLINGVPVVQIELKVFGVKPGRTIEQIVDYNTNPITANQLD